MVDYIHHQSFSDLLPPLHQLTPITPSSPGPQNKSQHGTKPPPPNKTNNRCQIRHRSAKGTVYLAASGSPLMPSLFKSVMALVAFIGTPPQRPPSNVARPRDDISWQVLGRGYGQPPCVEGEIIWVCLKIGYIPNYSHLIGIMIINHWVQWGTLFSDTPIYKPAMFHSYVMLDYQRVNQGKG